MTPSERLCPICDEPFPVSSDNPEQRFCSRRCACKGGKGRGHAPSTTPWRYPGTALAKSGRKAAE